jgi:hypothetical protein
LPLLHPGKLGTVIVLYNSYWIHPKQTQYG